jgi:hypothetical protein
LRSYAEVKSAAAFRRYDGVIQNLREQAMSPAQRRVQAARSRS